MSGELSRVPIGVDVGVGTGWRMNTATPMRGTIDACGGLLDMVMVVVVVMVPSWFWLT